MALNIDEAIKELELGVAVGKKEGTKRIVEALKLGMEALKLLKLADINGGAHTFKGKSVEQCIFIRKVDLQGGLLAALLSGKKEILKNGPENGTRN